MQASADVGVVGLSFGRVADDYDRLRPEYAPAAVDAVVAALAPTTALDLAAGTGKLTRALRERVPHVVAVEPDDAMRAKIGGDARAGTAEAITVEDASVDAVFVGDAFHWFDTSRAIAEIRRVLRPGGGLALLWNSWPIPDEGEARDLLDVTWRRFHGEATFEATWVAELEAAFGTFERATFPRAVVLDGDDYADLCLTASCPSALPDHERAELRHALRAALAGEHRLSVPTDAWWVRT